MTAPEDIQPGTIWRKGRHTTAVVVEVRDGRVHLAGGSVTTVGSFLANWLPVR